MDQNQPQDNDKPRRRLLPPLFDEADRFGLRPLRPSGLVARIALVVVGLFAFFFVIAGLTNVGATERDVVFHADGSLSILEPGKFQWVTPIVNDVTTYDVRDKTYTESAIGISLDLQETTTEVTVRYHPQVDAIQTIHQTLGRGYEDKVIVPAVQNCVKNAVSNFNVEQLTGSVRAQVNADIGSCITGTLAAANLVTSAVSVTDFDFSPQFNAAIEAKAIAQQKAQEERNRLEQVIYQANQTVVAARAQGEAATLLAQTGNSEVYMFLEWLKRWDGHLPTTLVGDDSAGILITPGAPATSG